MFPNLAYAMALRGMLAYELAAQANMSESRFSRCQRGRLPFTSAETARIAETLRFAEAWLFARPTPPRTACGTPAEVAAS